MKQLGEGWNWRDLGIGDRFTTYGRTLFESDLLSFVTLCGFSEELFTNKEYIASHAPMRGGHPVPGALVYSMAEGLVIPTTLQGTGLAFLSMGFDIKAPTYVTDKDSGELRRPHHIDLKTGMYRGRQVLTVKSTEA